MICIKTKVLPLNKYIYFNCDKNTLLKDYYKYAFKLIMDFDFVEDKNALSSFFCFVKNGKEQHAREDFEILEFLNNFNYELDDLIVSFKYVYGIGAYGDISNFIRIRLNSNEGKHNYFPHVHISRAFKDKPYCRIHLKTLTQMKEDATDWKDLFNNFERKK